jgi:hypothetical protein
MNFLREIWNAICDGAKALWDMCKRIIKACISFIHDILDGMFDVLEELLGGNVPPTVDESPIKPFFGDLNKMVQNAPTKNVGLFAQRKNNYIKGFYDTRTGKIQNPTYVAGDEVDSKLKETIGDEPVVILG